MGPPAARPPGADLDALLSKQTVQGRARTERYIIQSWLLRLRFYSHASGLGYCQCCLTVCCDTVVYKWLSCACVLGEQWISELHAAYRTRHNDRTGH